MSKRRAAAKRGAATRAVQREIARGLLPLRRLDTILAALRMWQTDVADDMTEAEGIPIDFVDIATAHGNALSSAEIDALCEAINAGEQIIAPKGGPNGGGERHKDV